MNWRILLIGFLLAIQIGLVSGCSGDTSAARTGDSKSNRIPPQPK